VEGPEGPGDPGPGGAGASDGPSIGFEPAADAGTTPPPADGATVTLPDPVLYAHTGDRLYRVDVGALTATLVGTFAFPGAETRVMSDVAIDRSGTLVGVSFDRIYSVGSSTANLVFVGSLVDEFNGLAFVPAGVMDASREVLVGCTSDGYLHAIDPASGVSDMVGEFGDGIESSGDLVYVPGQGLFATVIVDGGSTDQLARIDPATGRATVIGSTGYAELWGLAWLGGWIYGFNPAGDLVRLDPATGAGTLYATASLPWHGAATAVASP
jgi:hypothetical protein